MTYDAFLAVSYGPSCIERSPYRLAVESLVRQSAEMGLGIYAAPVEEAWGTLSFDRRTAIANDHSALRGCSIFIYFAGGFESDGALVELGMALALRKKIFIARWESEKLSSHVRGLIDL